MITKIPNIYYLDVEEFDKNRLEPKVKKGGIVIIPFISEIGIVHVKYSITKISKKIWLERI